MAIPPVPYPFQTWQEFLQKTLSWPYCYLKVPFPEFRPVVDIKNSISPVTNGITRPDSTYVEFQYPTFSTPGSPGSGVYPYSWWNWWSAWSGWYYNYYNPVVAAGFHVQVLEGKFSSVQVNYPKQYWSQAAQLQLETASSSAAGVWYYTNQTCNLPPPGPVVYDDVQFFSTDSGGFSTYLNLAAQNAKGKSFIPISVLKPGKEYTAIVRVLVTSPYPMNIYWNSTYYGWSSPYWFLQNTSTFGAFITTWGSTNFKVNQVPTALGLTIDGDATPDDLPSGSKVNLGFSVRDADGPQAQYQIQVGQDLGSGFSPFVWDTGMVNAGTSSASRSFSIPYAGPRLTPGLTYQWRVRPSDAISDGNWTETQEFSINQRPTITSMKVDGAEMITSTPPVVKNDNPTLSWAYFDPDGGTQKAYRLDVSEDGGGNILSVERFSTQSSIVLPVLVEGARMTVRLSVRDAVEYGGVFAATFKTNSRPAAQDLLVDGERNPTDVATATPTFSWTFVDRDSDSQSAFRIQVADDPSFSSLLWDTGAVSGASTSVVYGSTGGPLVGPLPLAHAGGIYFVRIQASDGISFSSFPNAEAGDSTAMGFFSINTEPGDPVLTSPTGGAQSGTIEVEWIPASPEDADGDLVYYVVEATDKFSTGSGWSQIAGPLPSPATSFSWDISRVRAGDDYAVRVIASDQYSQSDPDNGGTSQRLTILNHAPSAPSFARPAAGAIASITLLVEWVEADPPDIDGDAVTYLLELTRDFSAADPTWEKIGIFPSGTSKHSIRADGFDDGSRYNLRIRATDEHGASSEYVYTGEFTISNSLIAQDFQRINGEFYIGTSDGRVYRATEPFWQVEENWAQSSQATEFEVFQSGSPVVEIRDGKLVIRAPLGSTYILRQSKNRNAT
jgi:hypothetical protein